MRRLILAVLAAGSVLVTAVPAAAASTPATPEPPPPAAQGLDRGWEPAPSAPWEVDAGVRCDFPISGVPVVDEVKKLVLQTYPDGSAKRELYTGDLVVRITNLETGEWTDADASGDAVIEYRPDGSMVKWYVRGPVLVGIGEGGGNLPRGMWIIDGIFTIDFSPSFEKTITMVHGTQHNVCTDLA